MTAYTPSHSSSDTASVVIDLLVEFGIQAIQYVPLIVLALLAVFIVSRF